VCVTEATSSGQIIGYIQVPYKNLSNYQTNALQAAVLLEKLTVPQLAINSPHFIQIGVSLANSEDPAILLYSKPHKSSSRLPILFDEEPFEY
jgi:hypothetical protein